MTALLPEVEVWGPPPPADDDLPEPRPRPHKIRITCPHGCNQLVGWISNTGHGLDFDDYGQPWSAEAPEHMPFHAEIFARPGPAARWVLDQHDQDVHHAARRTDPHSVRVDEVVAACERLALGDTEPLVGTGFCLRCGAAMTMRDGVWSDDHDRTACPEPVDLCPNLCSPNSDYGPEVSTSCPHCHGSGSLFDVHHPIPDTAATGAVQDRSAR
jgi:hypothetical protein